MARFCSPSRRHGALPTFAGMVLLACCGAARAQDADCQRLQAAIDATAPAGGAQDQYARAAQHQRVEIARTRDYAASVGCGNPAYSGFDASQPEQCSGIEARLARMGDNLAQIEARGQQIGQDSGQRDRLLAQFDASCAQRPVPPGAVTDGDSVDPHIAPLDPDDQAVVPPADDAAPSRVGQAICVRSCDGGYFPLGRGVAQDQLDGLEQLCKASCPNAEAHLYTMTDDGDLDSAASVDGQPYTALPTAHRFEKSFSPSCTCKPPGQSWAQALAGAEALMEARPGDVTVTAALSETMAKPGAPLSLPPGKGKGRKHPDKAAASLPDVAAASESLRAARSPTATTASAGIGPATDQPGPVVKEGEGPTREVQGRDGIRKTVRVIAP